MGQKNQEVTEEKMLKALADLEDDILKAEAQSDDDSESASDDSESVSKSVRHHHKPARKSHVREDRAPLRALPKSTKEANQHLDDSAGTGEPADMSAKSFRDNARGNEHVRKGLDASQFLDGLVDNINDEVDGLRQAVVFLQDVHKSASDDQQAFNRKLSKAVVHMGNLMVEQSEIIKSLAGRPTGVRKSITSRGEVQERFQKSVGDEGGAPGIATGDYQFDKATVLRKAVDLVEKGMLPAPVAIAYETSDFMEPKFQQIVERELLKDAH